MERIGSAQYGRAFIKSGCKGSIAETILTYKATEIWNHTKKFVEMRGKGYSVTSTLTFRSPAMI